MSSEGPQSTQLCMFLLGHLQGQMMHFRWITPSLQESPPRPWPCSPAHCGRHSQLDPHLWDPQDLQFQTPAVLPSSSEECLWCVRMSQVAELGEAA